MSLFKGLTGWNLAVLPEYRKHGIASALINKVLQLGTSIGVSSIDLTVSELNIPAIKLYEKIGFKEISKKSNYYPDSSAGLDLSFKV